MLVLCENLWFVVEEAGDDDLDDVRSMETTATEEEHKKKKNSSVFSATKQRPSNEKRHVNTKTFQFGFVNGTTGGSCNCQLINTGCHFFFPSISL